MLKVPGTFRAASFNANSIRNRLPIILTWMAENECDVLCVQETKVQNHEFPIAEINAAGFNVIFKGQKTFNGVAIISPHEIKQITDQFEDSQYDDEARLLVAEIKDIIIINSYVPQGTDLKSPKFTYKLDWYAMIREYLETLEVNRNCLWMGDLNVARESIDVYDPDALYGCVCYNPKEHEAINKVLEWGLEDTFRKHHATDKHCFTFWDYRVPNAYKRKIGWRLDYIFASKPMYENCIDAWIDVEPRLLEKPSDHTFIVADFALNSQEEF